MKKNNSIFFLIFHNFILDWLPPLYIAFVSLYCIYAPIYSIVSLLYITIIITSVCIARYQPYKLHNILPVYRFLRTRFYEKFCFLYICIYVLTYMKK